MTALLIALVGALAFMGYIAWFAGVATSRARDDARDAQDQRHEADLAEERVRARLARLEIKYNALLKRQQNRRAAVQSGPLTGVIPDGRD